MYTDWKQRTGISATCRSYALVSTIATDLGNTVLYSSLLFGGTLHVFSRETVSHIEALHAYFEEHKIDCLKIVPSHWKALSPEDGPPLLPERMLIFGGEALACASQWHGSAGIAKGLPYIQPLRADGDDDRQAGI